MNIAIEARCSISTAGESRFFPAIFLCLVELVGRRLFVRLKMFHVDATEEISCEKK